jgi:hypothetical protein
VVGSLGCGIHRIRRVHPQICRKQGVAS